jgi:hypothetical protein
MGNDLISVHPLLGVDPHDEFEHSFLGFGNCQSKCNVKVWKSGDKRLVVLSDMGKGTSVTNAAEQIITELYNSKLKNLPKDNLIFAETYPYVEEDQTFDQIIPEWDGNSVKRVSWKHLATIVK